MAATWTVDLQVKGCMAQSLISDYQEPPDFYPQKNGFGGLRKSLVLIFIDFGAVAPPA